jgi:hypothetical protein
MMESRFFRGKCSVGLLAICLSLSAFVLLATSAHGKCDLRQVANTQGARLLVNSSPNADFSFLDRLHTGDSMRVIGQVQGREIRDSALGLASKEWLEIEYVKGADLKRGWVSSLYASCLDSCPYVEVVKAGVQTLPVRDTPYVKGAYVYSLYSGYIVKNLAQVTDGINIEDRALQKSSTKWHKVEMTSLLDGKPFTGWVNSLYAVCSHGRMNSRDGTLKLPVAGRILTSDEQAHIDRGSINAWDINAFLGTPIRPIAPGKIGYAGCDNKGGYGCWVYITHDNGLKTIMAHMKADSIRVQWGDRVTQDTIVGVVGWTGFTTFGPHVHLEIIDRNGIKQPIANYFSIDQMRYCHLCNVKD